jgi:hypothetical protein
MNWFEHDNKLFIDKHENRSFNYSKYSEVWDFIKAHNKNKNNYYEYISTNYNIRIYKNMLGKNVTRYMKSGCKLPNPPV